MMRKGLTLGLGLIALGSLILALPASAQESSPEALVITAVNVTAQQAERAADAGAYLPGDVIQYELRFSNVSQGAVQDVVLNDPIPGGLVMVLGSPTADREDVVVDYSIDGGTNWSASPMVKVQVAGQTVLRPAQADTYTHVRWTITGAVPVGATVTARFHAKVLGPNETGAAS